MKRYIALIALALAATAAMRGAEKTDTLALAAKADAVVISEEPDATTIIIYGIDGDSNATTTITQKHGEMRTVTTQRRYSRSSTTALDSHFFNRFYHDTSMRVDPWQFIIGGVGLGVNSAMGLTSGFGNQMFKSLNVTMLFCGGMQYRVPGTANSFNFGLGIDWRTYRAEYPQGCFTMDGPNVVLGAYPDGVAPRYSQLRTFSLMLPMLWRQHLPMRFPGCADMSLVLGPIVDFNVHGSLRNSWTNADGNRVEQTCGKIRQSPVTVELFGSLYLNSWLGLYVKYTPMHILRTPGLKFTSLSSGIICSF